MPKRVLITEAVNSPLDPLDGIDVDERVGIWRDPERLAVAIRTCDGLIVRNETKVNRALIATAPRLRVVGRLGAGLDNIDLDALREAGVALVHGGGLNAQAVAEFVIGACIAMARNTVRSDAEIRAGKWIRHVGLQLQGQTLGVVGLGATGAATARLARAIGMRVVGYDPFTSSRVDVEQLPLDEVLRRSRFVTLHVPLSTDTRGLFNAERLALLPRGAFLVNASRGEIVDDSALADAIESGALAGAALDVRSTEPPAAGDRLVAMDAVINTAHIAGLTEQSQAAIAARVLAGVRDALL